MAGRLGKSNMATKCTAATHDIAVGQDNYYEKINDKWIRCTDLECFKKQGGTYDPQAASGTRKAKTPEELFSYRKAFFELCWSYAKMRAREEIPDPKLHDITNDMDDQKVRANQVMLDAVIKDRRILASSFLYAITGVN